MASGRLEPITAAHLPSLARFLTRSLADMARDAGVASAGNDLASVEARLRWRLLANPSRGERSMGDCVCDADGEVVASIAYTPTAFRCGDARVYGLLGGYFFSAPSARGYGLVVFRRFLQAPGCEFAFSTSLNAASGALWKKLGGVVPSGCDRELLVPLAPGAVLADLAARRALPHAAARAVELAGALAAPLHRLATSAGPALDLEPCRDWDALAVIAASERDPEALVADLSPDVLAWRYDEHPARARIEVLRFGARGGDGWLATIESRRGRNAQLRTRTVVTLVRPRGGLDESALLRALVRRYAGRADLLVLGVPNAWSGFGPPRVLRRGLEHPPVYMTAAGSAGGRWCDRMRFSIGDGDQIE